MTAGMNDRYMVWAEDRPHQARGTSSWLRAQWWSVFSMGLPAFFRGKRMCMVRLR
ncbi:hypothetical protein [Sphingomonas sp. ACRSK]|uniref:hypothetical protein n=1 Tax=Sphingomonas sp. ACRSK TaxID=2918213 RepID=UPI001EF7498E|nr:hypothetical protein [Sphingomonas sp. ACRSK]MCG7348855.1 hypothetical protein [Sphingomonas sp. ACRSK]